MQLTLLKSKIHRATVTDAQLHYEGSIAIDPVLMEEANILEYEKVQVVNINNGERFETYVILGQPHSGEICLNGAAARLAVKGDKVIIMAYAQLTQEEAKTFKPTTFLVDEDNKKLRDITKAEQPQPTLIF